MSKNITAGDFDKKFSVETDIEIRFAGQFLILIDDEIIAPDNVASRHWKGILKKGQNLEVHTEGRYTIKQKEKVFRGEIANTESMVEIVPEGELSMLERYKAEMMAQISALAEEKGLDSFEEDNDLDWDEEDENLINTPYEYTEMAMEFPIDETNEEEKEENMEITEPEVEEAT